MNTLFTRFVQLTLLLILLFAAALGLTRTAAAAPQAGGIFTVNSDAGNSGLDSVLTLREAIELSNGGSGIGGLIHSLSNAEKAQIGGTCTFGGTADNGGTWNVTGGCGDGVVDTIQFNIPGSGVHTITLLSPLAVIDDPVIIDGYTQPGSKPNTLTVGSNAKLKIELQGIENNVNMSGLYITAGSSTVRGLRISRFQGSGIVLGTNGSNVIQGNFIGVTQAIEDDGIYISTNNNVIGGNDPADRNVISQNTNGVNIVGGSYNNILNNYLGTNPEGTAALPNVYDGVRVQNGAHQIIATNLLSGNGWGVALIGNGSVSNWVAGNRIGTDATGTKPLGNLHDGVYITGSQNIVGGSVKSQVNTIAHNGENGILIYNVNADTPHNNAIYRNSIFKNGELGIDLGDDGVTDNDFAQGPPYGPFTHDADQGANNLVNFPEIKSAVVSTHTVKGSLHSVPNMEFTLQFYANYKCDKSKYGQGEIYLGSVQVTTDNAGLAPFSFKSKNFTAGQRITATTTDNTYNTSEFSKCKTAQ